MQYEGEFKDGKFHGKGQIVFSSGEKLIGTFELGKV